MPNISKLAQKIAALVKESPLEMARKATALRADEASRMAKPSLPSLAEYEAAPPRFTPSNSAPTRSRLGQEPVYQGQEPTGYVIYRRGEDGAEVGFAETLQGALRSIDRRDNAYGAYVHKRQPMYDQNPPRTTKATPDLLASAVERLPMDEASRMAAKAPDPGVVLARPEGAPQEFSSRKTDIQQVAALLKIAPLKPRTINLDYGGGAADVGSQHLKKERGVQNHVFDPYNRTPEHNAAVLERFKAKPADSGTMANVLNVIKEPHLRAAAIQDLSDHVREGGKLYFSVYAGDRSGRGKKTLYGWQNNTSLLLYLKEVQAILPDAKISGKYIVATKRSSGDGLPPARSADSPLAHPGIGSPKGWY